MHKCNNISSKYIIPNEGQKVEERVSADAEKERQKKDAKVK